MRWTDEQFHTLRLKYDPFGPKICAEELGRSEVAVRVMACRLRKEDQRVESARNLRNKQSVKHKLHKDN